MRADSDPLSDSRIGCLLEPGGHSGSSEIGTHDYGASSIERESFDQESPISRGTEQLRAVGSSLRHLYDAKKRVQLAWDLEEGRTLREGGCNHSSPCSSTQENGASNYRAFQPSRSLPPLQAAGSDKLRMQPRSDAGHSVDDRAGEKTTPTGRHQTTTTGRARAVNVRYALNSSRWGDLAEIAPYASCDGPENRSSNFIQQCGASDC